MSKRIDIRWRSVDNQTLTRAVNNFNAKIRRVEKKADKILNNPKATSQQRAEARDMKRALPERANAKYLRGLIETRQDFNREVKALKRFSEKGAEDVVSVPNNKNNLKITKWQKEEMSRRLAPINRKRAKRYEYISKMQVKSRGEDVGYTVGMRSTDEIATSPLKAFYETMVKKDLNDIYKHIQKEAKESYWIDKERALKENFMNGIIGNYKGLFPDDVKAILERVREMSFEEFYETFMGEPGEMEVVSPPPGSSMDQNMEVNMELLKSTWIPNYESPMQDKVNDARQELRDRIENRKKRKR